MIKALTRKSTIQYDVTIFQTPKQREKKGHKQVYRTFVPAVSREHCLRETFSRFNVTDRIPVNYKGRFLSTGDIVLIDEGRSGQYYYQLQPGGWVPINRIILFPNHK
ncbi:YodL domain-containing protein [Neobacillus dielmonensis]|uniref:YodL domain-containing protein n=1 Tax=Neobacillus dielmonensis TaxID=1347369 RepID=UPI0005A7D600|nr:YodL domain-containing protein [Neobacillus dielmonensis]